MKKPTASKAKPKLLICVSSKDHSITALKFAVTKAEATDSLVEMMCVIDPVDYNTIFSVADVIKEERRLEAEDLLKNLSTEVKSWTTNVKPSKKIREGRIIDEIINHIEENPSINMLVLGVASDGSSNKGGLLPQLTSAIGDKFHIPLLLVPGNLSDKDIGNLT